MLGVFSVVSCHMICGQFSNWFGANISLLGANNLLLGARRFRSFSVMFGAFATRYSQSQYIWSSKLLQSTCSLTRDSRAWPPEPTVSISHVVIERL